MNTTNKLGTWFGEMLWGKWFDGMIRKSAQG
jgi:hypothetical protein